MKVNLHICRVTDSPHPYPWKAWWCVDTPYGNCTGEELFDSEESAVAGAEARIAQWVRDRKTTKETFRVVEIEVDLGDSDG